MVFDDLGQRVDDVLHGDFLSGLARYAADAEIPINSSEDAIVGHLEYNQFRLGILKSI